MSASFVDDDSNLHYALGRGADALFFQRRNALRPGFYRIFAELFAFRRRAHRDVVEERIPEHVDLRTYLAPYSSTFRDNLVVPARVRHLVLARRRRARPIPRATSFASS